MARRRQEPRWPTPRRPGEMPARKPPELLWRRGRWFRTDIIDGRRSADVSQFKADHLLYHDRALRHPPLHRYIQEIPAAEDEVYAVAQPRHADPAAANVDSLPGTTSAFATSITARHPRSRSLPPTMARTKQQPRRTSALQCRGQVERRQPAPLCRRGRWFHINIVEGIKSTQSLSLLQPGDELFGDRALCQVGLDYYMDRVPAAERETFVPVHPRTREERYRERTKKCYLLALPEELLQYIMRELVPHGGVFHIMDFQSYYRPKAKLLHALCPRFQGSSHEKSEVAVRPNLTAIARTCKQLHRLFVEVLYGENQWVFDYSAAFQRRPDVAVAASAGDIETWARMSDDEETNAIWPLTNATIPYVRSLTVRKTVAIEPLGWSAEQKISNERSPPMLTAFGGSRHYLRRLSVSIVPYVANYGREKVRLRCVGGQCGSIRLDLVERGYHDETPEYVKMFWAPVRALGPVREVEVCGLLSEEDAGGILGKLAPSAKVPAAAQPQ